MQKFIIFSREAAFILTLIAVFSTACVDSSDSKQIALNQNTATPPPPPPPSPSPEPTAASPTPTVSPTPDISPSPEPTAAATPTQSPVDDPFVEYNNAVKNNQTDAQNNKNTAPVAPPSETLMIPVIGIKREDLRDTFDDARSEGRVHDAIDIMAAGGTPIVAAIDGKIIKFFESVRGGITIYQLGPDEHTIYYYAHLQRRADGLQEGASVKQGDLLGFVGDTGNAGPGNYHLHFAIWTISDPKHFYDGVNLNPYPLLKQGIIKPQ